MKQALWIVNSSLIGTCVVALSILQVLYKNPPRIGKLTIPDQQTEKKKHTVAPAHWETIFKHDLFDTYIPKSVPVIKKNLVTSPPELSEPPQPRIPETKKPEFIPELALTIKGIIVAADETQNIVMLEDESKKEGIYHLGDLYKDGQIIRIARNSVTFLRASGQQETFYLRKEEADLAMNGPAKWEYIIKKNPEGMWLIDPESFKREIDSLGLFLDGLNLVGAAYQQGTSKGLRVGDLAENQLGSLLGLKKGDILLSINDVSVAQADNRVAIFDKICASKINDVITAKISRDGNEVTNTYQLAYISKAKKMLFSDNKAKEGDKPEDALKMSKIQERDKQIREFNERHEANDQQKDAIAQVRKRLLENLRARLQGAKGR